MKWPRLTEFFPAPGCSHPVALYHGSNVLPCRLEGQALTFLPKSHQGLQQFLLGQFSLSNWRSFGAQEGRSVPGDMQPPCHFFDFIRIYSVCYTANLAIIRLSQNNVPGWYGVDSPHQLSLNQRSPSGSCTVTPTSSGVLLRRSKQLGNAQFSSSFFPWACMDRNIAFSTSVRIGPASGSVSFFQVFQVSDNTLKCFQNILTSPGDMIFRTPSFPEFPFRQATRRGSAPGPLHLGKGRSVQ